MDVARRNDTGEEITGEQLWEIPAPRELTYSCPGCTLRLTPAACDLDKRQEYRRRAHFKRPEGIPHDPGCWVDGWDEIEKKGKRKPILTIDQHSHLGYGRLRIPTHNARAASDTLESRAPGRPQHHASESASNLSINPPHEKLASHLTPIARQYVNFPHDHGHRLSIPGATGTYRDLFVHIDDALGGGAGTKVFFAQISRKRIEVVGAKMAVYLFAGQRQTAAANPAEPAFKLVRQAKVLIATDNWTERERRALSRVLYVTQEEERTGGKTEKGYVFFVATQNPGDPLTFEVCDRHLVTAFVADIPRRPHTRIYPPQPPACEADQPTPIDRPVMVRQPAPITPVDPVTISNPITTSAPVTIPDPVIAPVARGYREFKSTTDFKIEDAQVVEPAHVVERARGPFRSILRYLGRLVGA